MYKKIRNESIFIKPNSIKFRKMRVKNKKVFELDFDSQDKFKSLKKKRLTFSRSAFVTIQEGCDKFCNFCVVPYTRGPEYSRSPLEIIKEVKDLISNGAVSYTHLTLPTKRIV